MHRRRAKPRFHVAAVVAAAVVVIIDLLGLVSCSPGGDQSGDARTANFDSGKRGASGAATNIGRHTGIPVQRVQHVQNQVSDA